MRCYSVAIAALMVLFVFQLPARKVDTEKALADSIKQAEGQMIYSLAERYHRLYIDKNPKSVLEYDRKALKVAISSKNENQKAAFQHRIALCLYKLNKGEEALKYDSQSLALFKKLKSQAGMAKCFTTIGKHYYRESEYEKAEKNLVEAYKTAKQSSDPELVINALEIMANLAQKRKNISASIPYHYEAYQISKSMGDINDVAYFAMNLGIAYQSLSVYDKSLEFFEESRIMLEKKKDNSGLAKVYNNMGNSYLKMGNYEKSLSYHLKSLELKETNSSPEEISVAMVNLGTLYMKLERYPKAIEHYTKAIKLKKELKDDIGLASTYSSLGVAYRNLGYYDKSLSSYQKAVNIYTKKNDKKRLALTLNNMGVLYSKNNEIDKALQFFNRSLALYGNNSDMASLVSVYLNIVDIYLNKRVNLTKAEYYLSLAQGFKSIGQVPDLKQTLLWQLSILHEHKKEYPVALQYHKEYEALKDSISANRNSQLLARQDVRYELSDKEKQIDILRKNAELSKQILSKSKQLRNYLIIIIVLVFLTLIVIVGRYRSLRKYNKLIVENDNKLHALNQSLELRVETEVNIRRQNEQRAFQQARLATLGELAAGIAHELNQPLHSLAFTLDNILLYLKEEKADPDYLNNKLDYLFEDISRMRSAIDHIRQFSRQKQDQPDALFSVNEAILQTVELVKKQYAKLGIDVVTELQEDLPLVLGNPYKLEQVMLNLLANSRDAIMQKYPDKQHPRQQIVLSSLLLGEMLHICCQDFGIGMNDEVLEKAFQSFYTTKDTNQGTGLGLTISKGIINAWGGDITLSCSEDKGTLVSIMLPISKTHKGA